uniref:Cytochrome n=1 Tax=Ixodes ricinus TaxID=34613 RepID=A0A6B0VDT0_IXORI
MLDIVWKCLATGCVAGLGVLLVQYFWDQLKRNFKKGLPPGPYGLPFVGYLPFMSKDGYRGVEALKEKYGTVFGVTLGSRYVVFLCDFGSIKEALSQDSLLDRPDVFPFMVHKESQGLVVLNGPLWKEQRRFSLRLFKNLGMATQVMERHIHDEVGHLLQEFRDKKNKPVAPTTLLAPSTSNIISALVFGQRFEYSDPARIYLDKLVQIIPALATQTSFLNFFPWLRNLMVFFKLGVWERLRDALVRREDFVESKIDFHHETYQDGVVRDYIDGYIYEMRNGEGDQKTFTKSLLKGNVGSFFGAGSETVLAAIDWLLLMSAVYPERQKKIQAEIDEVVGGTDRQVAWSDRTKMPFTQAFMWEVMRYKPVSPISLMRYASKDVAVGSFVIPEGSVVISSFWSVFHDAKLWGDPECFRPERFLVDGGTRALKPDCFIPFSYGKRSCPGKVIANLEVFIYFTTLLQHFNVEPPPNGPKLVVDEVFGLAVRPKPQGLVFRQR